MVLLFQERFGDCPHCMLTDDIAKGGLDVPDLAPSSHSEVMAPAHRLNSYAPCWSELWTLPLAQALAPLHAWQPEVYVAYEDVLGRHGLEVLDSDELTHQTTG